MIALDFTRDRASDDRLDDAIRESVEANSILAMFDVHRWAWALSTVTFGSFASMKHLLEPLGAPDRRS